MKIYKGLFNRITSVEHLFSAWDVFEGDKRKKTDVQEFSLDLEQHIFKLHRELVSKSYRHGPYKDFYIADPKQRHIHKALVRDRVLHHAVFSVVNPIFEETFIPTSFSCRIGYGVHRGIRQLKKMAQSVSRNNTRSCFALKCDIRKFFDNIDHKILFSVIMKRISDKDTLWLLEEIVESFGTSPGPLFPKKGLPIGNLTSQLFANVYMNEFDQFVKQQLKVKDYLRYTDDFMVLSPDRSYLEQLLPRLEAFLSDKLALQLHPKKVTIRRLTQGVDFLGYVTFPRHRLLRSKTQKRAFVKSNRRLQEYRNGKISQGTLEGSLNSYLGVFSHADAYELSEKMKNNFWLK